MSTIIVKHPRPTPIEPALDPATFINDTHDAEPHKRTIAEFLIKIGQKVLEHDYAEDWLSMAEVAAYARRYKIRWRSSNARAREMAESLFHYVNQVSFDIRGSGVVVKYRSDWNEPKRREEYSILFRQLLPDGSAAC